jgi:hypothetical protein
MADRREKPRSLDFYPTPPFATRALVECVLPELGVHQLGSVWEPAAGKGHMAEVLREYCECLRISDIAAKRYKYGDKLDFLDSCQAWNSSHDWVITNPPFKNRTIPFVLKALEVASVGVAMFLRSQWIIEGCERHGKIFVPHPPTMVAFFTERVCLKKGRWDPDGSTATAYCWVVWLKGARRRPPYWIPPGCKRRFTKVDDRERFA